MTENVNELMEKLSLNGHITSETVSETVSETSLDELMENLEINSYPKYIDYFEKLNDAYNRYNYILENVEFTIETFFIENNIKTFIDYFLEYKIDTFLLYKFTENIDYQIELYLAEPMDSTSARLSYKS